MTPNKKQTKNIIINNFLLVIFIFGFLGPYLDGDEGLLLALITLGEGHMQCQCSNQGWQCARQEPYGAIFLTQAFET